MEKRLLIAVVISFIILYAYQIIFYPEPDKPVKKVDEKNVKSKNIKSTPVKKTAVLTKHAEHIVKKEREYLDVNSETVSINTDLYEIIMTNKGACFSSIKLMKYTDLKTGGNFNILQPGKLIEGSPLPLTIDIGNNNELINANFKIEKNEELEKEFSYITKGYYKNLSGEEVKSNIPEGLRIVKDFNFKRDTYTITVNISIEDLNRSIEKLKFINWQGKSDTYTGSIALNWLTGTTYERNSNLINYYTNNDLKESKTDGKEAKNEIIAIQNSDWISCSSLYFLSLLNMKRVHPNAAKIISSGMNMGYSVLLSPLYMKGYKTEISLDCYIGPKEYYLLKTSLPGIKAEEVIDYGWFGWFSLILLKILKFFYKLIPNYGIAIILLTLFVNVIMYPLKYKSMKSMQEMQKLQPLINKLKEKHKDDKAKVQSETMKLYKEHKINPMGGCLPIFLQLPIFIGLFRMLQNSIEIRGAAFLYLKDLSAPDTFLTGLLNLPFTLGPLPLIMGATMFIQQKMTPNPNPEQGKMMMFLPLIFTIMFIKMPSGLILYWTVFNIIGIIQQFIQNKFKKT